MLGDASNYVVKKAHPDAQAKEDGNADYGDANASSRTPQCSQRVLGLVMKPGGFTRIRPDQIAIGRVQVNVG